MASGDSPVRLASFEDVLDGGYTVYTATGGAFHGFFLNANEGSAAKKVGEVALRTPTWHTQLFEVFSRI